MAETFRPSQELADLTDLALTGQIDGSQIRQLEALLHADVDALRWYRDMVSLQIDLRIMMTANRSHQQALARLNTARLEAQTEVPAYQVPLCQFPSQPVKKILSAVDERNDPRSQRLQSSSPRSSRSPVLGFLRKLLRAGNETPSVTALMWLVMALLMSGIVLTVFFTIVLIIRGPGANLHGDVPQVAEQKAETEEAEGGGTGHPRSGSAETVASNPPSAVPLPPSSATVARLIHSSDCHWAIGSHSPHVGDDLEPGRKLALMSGLAEIMFESGVRALLQGPATMEVDSRNSLYLRKGKLAVRVENPDARGFEVSTPGMKYTDLGTEFAVLVATDGRQEMHVFRGKVKAEGASDSNAPPSPSPQPLAPSPQPLILSADQAIRVLAPGKPLVPIKAETKLFVRKMPTLAPFALFSSGFGLGRGAADPHWTITAVSTDPKFVPRPATVCERNYGYPTDSPKTAQWISLTKVLKAMPAGCRVTFRTEFDLTGFDPATARIDGVSIADNWVIEVRLNGQPVAIPAVDKKLVVPKVPLHVASGFASGRNTLEVVVENGPDAMGRPGHNVMALYFQCSGAAIKLQDVPAREP